jgi:C-terminal processing protease CtpA/Prc
VRKYAFALNIYAQGIFVSRVSSDGPAAAQGVHVGDKVLKVAGESVLHVDHQKVVELMLRAGDTIEMTLLTLQEDVSAPSLKSTPSVEAKHSTDSLR